VGLESEQLLVAVVDDDPAVRDSVQLLLKSVGLTGAGFATAQEFLGRQDPGKVGCLVLDVRLPGMSGLALLELLRQRGADVPAVVVSAYGDVPTAVRAMKAGALDFLEKPAKPQHLLDVIQAALQQGQRRLQGHADRAEFAARLETLTPREREVLELLVAGKSNTEVATDLDISRKTLDIHRAKVLHKIGARSVPALVSLVWQFAPFSPAPAALGPVGTLLKQEAGAEHFSEEERPRRGRGRPRKS
jgi:two-component system, LuxR family, response regulator FixJ